MSTFENFYDELKTEVSGLAESTFKTCKATALTDCEACLQAMKGELERLTIKLSTGKLSQEEYVWIVGSMKDGIILNALKQQGITQVEMDNFKQSLVEKIITVSLKYFAVVVLSV